MGSYFDLFFKLTYISLAVKGIKGESGWDWNFYKKKALEVSRRAWGQFTHWSNQVLPDL
jgi:hypothetical protein